MKHFIVILTSVSLSYGLLAQDTSHVISTSPSGSVVESPTGPVLSSFPTAQELADLFTSGEFNRWDAVRTAAEKGDNAIAGLAELLQSESLRGSVEMFPDSAGIQPNKMYAVLTLEAIASEQAFNVLLQAANSHSNDEIRAIALNALVGAYNEKARKGSLIPVSAVVGILVESLENQMYVGFLQKDVSQIAQDGLMKWLGLDFGDPQFSEQRKVAGDAEKEATATEYARVWWQEKREKLGWNKEIGYFEVK